MKLYFSPLAASLAARIAIYEAGGVVEFVEVDRITKTMSDGGDYRSIHPLGLVPALLLDDGTLLTENAAILQYIAESHPEAGLAPRDPVASARLRQWLSFVGAELHKTIFYPLFDPASSDAVKAYALAKAEVRLSWLAAQLEGREFLLDRFSVADAHLITVLNWTSVTPLELARWPSLATYAQRIRARPHVARAIAEERPLYSGWLARRSA